MRADVMEGWEREKSDNVRWKRTDMRWENIEISPKERDTRREIYKIVKWDHQNDMRYKRCHGEYNENLHHEMRCRNETKNTIFRYDINIMRLNGGKPKKEVK